MRWTTRSVGRAVRGEKSRRYYPRGEVKKTPLASALSGRAGRQTGMRIAAGSSENTKIRKCGNAEMQKCRNAEMQKAGGAEKPRGAKRGLCTCSPGRQEAKPSTHARDALFFFFLLLSWLSFLFRVPTTAPGIQRPAVHAKPR